MRSTAFLGRRDLRSANREWRTDVIEPVWVGGDRAQNVCDQTLTAPDCE